MSNYDDFYIGDDVHLIDDPKVQGRIHHLDASYAFVRINNDILPFKYESLELDKNRPLGIGLFLLSVSIVIALGLLIFGV